ncbi:MAG: hypothetical protein MI745_11025, partial [Pseudomonadales bacterium]|nr:hypothetical protein [Pseudomonadales bacterium]
LLLAMSAFALAASISPGPGLLAVIGRVPGFEKIRVVACRSLRTIKSSLPGWTHLGHNKDHRIRVNRP